MKPFAIEHYIINERDSAELIREIKETAEIFGLKNMHENQYYELENKVLQMEEESFMQNDTISVIIPVYNTEPYLHKCIDSILAQTYTNLEIILVDDGSTDKSGEICDEYAKNNPGGVQVIHKENGGVSSARNAGLDAAKGEYIAFIDADDYVAENYLEVLMADAKKYNADIASCDHLQITGNDYDGIVTNGLGGESDRFINKKEIYSEFFSGVKLKAADIVVWGKIIKKDLALSVRFENISYSEDKLYMLEIYAGNPIVYFDTYKGYYHIMRVNSAMGQTERKYDKKWERRLNDIYVVWRHLNIVRHFNNKRMMRQCIWGYIIIYCNVLRVHMMKMLPKGRE